MRRLLDVLRRDLALTGAKEGCGEGECGACTVWVDRQPVCACLIPIGQLAGAEVWTIEGLSPDHPLFAAFTKHGAAQCGICTPGMIMTAAALHSGATRSEIQDALAGNLCRCTGYAAIYGAVEAASRDT